MEASNTAASSCFLFPSVVSQNVVEKEGILFIYYKEVFKQNENVAWKCKLFNKACLRLRPNTTVPIVDGLTHYFEKLSL